MQAPAMIPNVAASYGAQFAAPFGVPPAFPTVVPAVETVPFMDGALAVEGTPVKRRPGRPKKSTTNSKAPMTANPMETMPGMLPGMLSAAVMSPMTPNGYATVPMTPTSIQAPVPSFPIMTTPPSAGHAILPLTPVSMQASMPLTLPVPLTPTPIGATFTPVMRPLTPLPSLYEKDVAEGISGVESDLTDIDEDQRSTKIVSGDAGV